LVVERGNKCGLTIMRNYYHRHKCKMRILERADRREKKRVWVTVVRQDKTAC
jgi:hypothetical protein